MDFNGLLIKPGMKVLVTGGSGFIGSHLVESLLEQGAKVTCLVRNQSKLKFLTDSRIQFIWGDLNNKADCVEAIRAHQVIYHAGGVGLSRIGLNPHTNINGTQNLFEACVEDKQERTLIYISSLKAAKPSRNLVPVTEEEASEPTDIYGRSKYNAERLLHDAPSYLNVLIVRPPTVFGPRDNNLLPLFKMVHHGYVPIFKNNGGARFSIIYVKDLVQFLVGLKREQIRHFDTVFITNQRYYCWNEFMMQLAVASPQPYRKIRLSPSTLYRLGQCMSMLSSVLGKPGKLPIERLNDIFKYHWICSAEKALSVYQYTPNTPFEKAVEDTWSWYSKKGWIS